jgi:hypothetical protein
MTAAAAANPIAMLKRFIFSPFRLGAVFPAADPFICWTRPKAASLLYVFRSEITKKISA